MPRFILPDMNKQVTTDGGASRQPGQTFHPQSRAMEGLRADR